MIFDISKDLKAKQDIALNRQTLGYTKKNLWSHGDVSGTQVSVIKDINLEIGTYTISALVTSSDTDKSASLLNIYCEDGSYVTVYFKRDVRKAYPVTFNSKPVSFGFYASETGTLSASDTFTYADIQIEVGDTATPYEPYVDDVDTRLTEITETQLGGCRFKYEDGKFYIGHDDGTGETEV